MNDAPDASHPQPKPKSTSFDGHDLALAHLPFAIEEKRADAVEERWTEHHQANAMGRTVLFAWCREVARVRLDAKKPNSMSILKMDDDIDVEAQGLEANVEDLHVALTCARYEINRRMDELVLSNGKRCRCRCCLGETDP